MASPVTELEGILQEMVNLKPPGVSGSKIAKTITLCVENVQSESVLVQKIYTHFKKAPGTHKLGALYVVDSVTRKWLERAKVENQTANSQAKDGTFAAGVHRVTELMPVLMNDILSSAPPAHKEKIKKLVDIWEKGQTFPPELIKSFRSKLAAMEPPRESTTPKNSPPPELVASYGREAASSKPVLPNTSAVMEALAKMARQNTSIPHSNSNGAAPASVPVSSPPPLATGFGAVGPYGAPLQQPVNAALGYQPATPVNMPTLPFSLPTQAPLHALPAQAPAPGVALNGTNPLASILGGLMMPGMPASMPAHAPAPAPVSAGLDPAWQRQLAIVQTLAAQGIPYEQIPALMQSMAALAPNLGQTQFTGLGPVSHGSWPTTARPSGSRDDIRSPTYRGRSRSRSPGRGGWSSRDSPRGSGQDRFGDYGRNSPSRDRDSRRGDYRQRSPHGRRNHSPTPPRPVPRGEKLVEYDQTLPRDHIKVFSRTLFVGGVTCSESELRSVFTRYGEVQTCIVNREKRHAFVKMTNRKDAEAAKNAMEKSRGSDYQFRTRWGVGFGPRDCSDFNSGPDATGTSIIPIHKLTDADCKWMLTAEFGGSGGKPIEHGLVVEEPDIEIGAGVSSKAISRRLQTGKGQNADGSEREEEQDVSSSWRTRRGNSRRDDGPAIGDRGASDAPVLNFPFGLGNALASLPGYQAANFGFPDPSQATHPQ